MASLLALLSSVLWGSSDFFGGNLSKRYKAFAVTGVSQAIGLVTALVLVISTGEFSAPNLSWSGYFLPGVCAGVLGFAGLISLYAGLATGRMGVVSPISSLSTLIPLGVALIGGERPKSLQIIGIAIALIGGFCATGPDIAQGLPIKPLLYGMGAAFGFGTALSFMAQGSKTSALLTMTSMRVSTVSICLIIALRFRTIGGFKIGNLPVLIFIGVTDFMANYLLGIATTKGLVSVAMVLGSLFPIVTAILAFRFLHERLHKIQYLGILLAVGGVGLISLA
ncbi:MAG: DMT family transporter [Actinobacteria bacterium]|jgi:drug/metabolite transporter (DMT)-like permease|nr:DMT family transporter [Actinomycetota bacterium]